MNRRCRDLETLTCVETFQIRLKCVKLWSGELGVVNCEPAVSGWLHRLLVMSSGALRILSFLLGKKSKVMNASV
jgi:hypothetical protein